MNYLPTILMGYALVVLLLIALFVVQRRTGNAAIADAGWTGGMILLTAWFAYWAAPHTWRTLVVAGLAVGWALRLTHHILFYRVFGRPEDGRYAAMRAFWGEKAQFKLFWFFQGQAAVALVFSVPIWIALLAPRATLQGWDFAGLLVWLLAVGGESLADHQLEQFRHQPANKGRTCRQGLWRYSRHPNYFFEWLHWWAYVCFAVGHSYWWLTLAAPALMLVFLFKVTGIPYTENQALKSRGDDYRQYQATTPVFFPWFPKESK